MATRRKTGGRTKGTPNRSTVIRKQLAERGMQTLLEDGVLPLEVMLRRMRGDDSITDNQFAAAIAAAPYVHPKLSAVEMNAVLERKATELTDEELAAIASSGGAGTADEETHSGQLH